jgi:hypothetical protein
LGDAVDDAEIAQSVALNAAEKVATAVTEMAASGAVERIRNAMANNEAMSAARAVADILLIIFRGVADYIWEGIKEYINLRFGEFLDAIGKVFGIVKDVGNFLICVGYWVGLPEIVTVGATAQGDLGVIIE